MSSVSTTLRSCQSCGAASVQTWRLCGQCAAEVAYCAACGGDDRAYAEMSAHIALEHREVKTPSVADAKLRAE